MGKLDKLIINTFLTNQTQIFNSTWLNKWVKLYLYIPLEVKFKFQNWTRLIWTLIPF